MEASSRGFGATRSARPARSATVVAVAKATATGSGSTIDTEEVFPEEIPAELLDRVSENHAFLRSMALQVRRNNTWKHLRAGTRTFQESPPSIPPHDICTLLVRAARLDAEESPGIDLQRYRVRMRCRQGNHEYTKFASVRGFIDDAGDLQIVDDEGGGDESVVKALQASAAAADARCERFAGIAFACLDRVMGCVQGFANIASTFNDVLGAAGAQWSTQVNAKVELLRVQMEMEQNAHVHEEKMKKWDKGFSILEGPVGRIGDEIVEFAVEGMKAKRAKQRRERQQARAAGNGSAAPHKEAPPKCEQAETLDDIFGELTEEKIVAVREIMTPDEWKLIEVARRASSTQAFDAAFNRFYALLKQRGDNGTTEWITKIAPLIGKDALTEIGMLIKRIERPDETAASAS